MNIRPSVFSIKAVTDALSSTFLEITRTFFPGGGGADKNALDVNILGGVSTSTPTGLSTGLTTVISTINDAGWVPVPTVAFTGRAGFSIQNQSGFEIKVNFGTPATYIGVIIKNGGERFYSLKAVGVINARSIPGSGTITDVVVEEVKP